MIKYIIHCQQSCGSYNFCRIQILLFITVPGNLVGPGLCKFGSSISTRFADPNLKNRSEIDWNLLRPFTKLDSHTFLKNPEQTKRSRKKRVIFLVAQPLRPPHFFSEFFFREYCMSQKSSFWNTLYNNGHDCSDIQQHKILSFNFGQCDALSSSIVFWSSLQVI